MVDIPDSKIEASAFKRLAISHLRNLPKMAEAAAPLPLALIAISTAFLLWGAPHPRGCLRLADAMPLAGECNRATVNTLSDIKK